ncbi:GtrA family protein [Maridesulfovibrio zosterae]|uniref:GtrA family protein n=1 Tax=Maridesulfovibrio zosterae TaxID=82171 RepID=UPI00041E8DEC|nr:GtrA family protein [Maridesulfovibrio zosterae]
MEELSNIWSMKKVNFIKNLPSRKELLRFIRYGCVGSVTFIFDLIMLFIFTQLFDLPPVYSAGLSFIIAVSINYFISRIFVFKGTTRPLKQGYLRFMLIALGGVIIVTLGMHIMVITLKWQYIISRILIAAITGICNYSLNLYVNFRVAGKHF